MSWYFIILIFLSSFLILSWISSRLIDNLVQIARYLRWKEFVIAFFVMSFITSLPNLFIDISAAVQGFPQLAFGDIIGGNLVDLTFVLAIAVFFSRKGLSTESEMVQKSAIFTMIITVLPLFLILDGNLSRTDGVILFLAFIFYSYWLFSKSNRFRKIYKSEIKNPVREFRGFLINLSKMIVFFVLLLAASQAIISSAQFFSGKIGISLALTGILIVGLGNCFPEIYFSIVSAKKEKNWLILGDLMGSVIVCATLVLGIIALIAPFEIKDISPFVTARIFLIVAAVMSLVFIKTGKKITKKEGLYLLLVYIAFLIFEVFIQ